MKQSRGIRNLALLALVFLLSACSQTYSYVPSVSKPAPVPEGAASQPGAPPAAEAPAPAPDLPQQVKALETRVQQLETRLGELEAPKAAPAAATRGKEKATPAARGPASSTSGYPAATAGPGEKSFHEGMKLYQGKKYGGARTQFSQYLKAHPQGAKAAEARYYLADSFYQEGKYREAGVEFNKMASQSPKSVLAPAAVLRQAMAYKQQQQTAAYQSTLKKLVKAYPSSPEAKEAQKWLKEEKKGASH